MLLSPLFPILKRVYVQVELTVTGYYCQYEEEMPMLFVNVAIQ